MAKDVITRFRLETSSFDSKLRDASKGLSAYSKQAEMSGKEFAKFTQKGVEAAKSLGTIATSANNTKDKLKELVGAYNDVAKAYNSLTEEQRNSDFAKAMAQSLQTLQSRIKETKDELYSLKDVGGKGGGLFGGNGLTGALAVAGGNLIASGVTKLAGEMKDTIQQSVELAKAGEGVRLAFERLNQPGLLDKLKESTHGTVSELELMKAAVKFDDFKLPVEELGTLLAFAQKKAKDTGQSVDYMVDSIVTGLGRKSLMILDNLGLSAAQIKDRMKEGGDMTKAVAEIIREEMEKAGEYVETAADRAARAAADASNKMEDLGRKAMPMAESWTEAWNSIKTGGMELLTTVLNPIAESINYINSLLASTPEDVFTRNWKGGQVGSNVDDNGNYIKRPAQKGAAGFDWESGTWKPGYSGAIYNSATGQTELPEIVAVGKSIQKSSGKGGKGGKSGSTGPSMPKNVRWDNYIDKVNLGAEELKGSDIKETMSVWATMSDEAKKIMLGLAEATEDLGDAQAKLGNENVTDEIAQRVKLLDQQNKAMNMAAQAANNFGAALAGLDDPSARAAGTVIQAIANITLGFSQAAAQAGSMGPWGWLAYVAAGAGALATTISTIHSLTGYAQGGMVEGNKYSGDQIPAMLNAGELVLTKAMQGNLASQLQGNGGGGRGGYTPSHVSGEQIWIALNAFTKRTGKGEVVTWR